MTADADTKTAGTGEAGAAKAVKKRSLYKRFRRFLKQGSDALWLVPAETPVAVPAVCRIAWDSGSFKLTLVKVTLEFHPDLAITGEDNDGDREWIVIAGPSFFEGVPEFIRIRDRQTLVLGRGEGEQERIFGFDESVLGKHVKIFNRKGALTLQPIGPEARTFVEAIEGPGSVWTARRDNLLRLPDLLGHPLAPFGDEEALNILQAVNDCLAKEAFRETDDDGDPGGIVKFPDDMTVVLMGDIHASADNLLRVLTEGGLLKALEKNEACLVLLGDLIHNQEKDQLEDMEPSVFIIDLFCMLKLRFPKNVFYIRGNHESFSHEVGKGGVPQGMLFRKHLKKSRGKVYVAEMERLFEGLAFIVQGNRFAASHGAPVRSKVDRDTLVNIRRYPGLQSELVWNRLRQGNRPAGYGKGSVKRFRQTLDLPKHAPVFVAHTPLSVNETMWFDVGGIAGHHVVYSAYPGRLAAVVMSNGTLTPLEFVPEPALEFVADQADAAPQPMNMPRKV